MSDAGLGGFVVVAVLPLPPPPPSPAFCSFTYTEKRNMVFASITDFTHLTEYLFSRGKRAVKVRNE
jgi:hypothetical protein